MEPPTVPAAAVIAELQRYAAFVGLVLTARCATCGRPLFAAASIHARRGPTCRRRQQAETPQRKQ